MIEEMNSQAAVLAIAAIPTAGGKQKTRGLDQGSINRANAFTI
jgi:hypothetical protein